MTMTAFIQSRIEDILADWDSFARSIQPDSKPMTAGRLRDHAREMLNAITADMTREQTPAEQKSKSEGRAPRDGTSGDSPAEMHALHRLAEGFSINEIVAEYRALRASVIRLWTREMGQANRANLDELTRFNESVDEALCESVERYTGRIERSRDLLLGALGHDLRNPLGAMLQSAQYLMRAEGLHSGQTKAATRIVTSGTRMKEMISDLLDFATTRLGDVLRISVSEVDMRDACRMACEEIVALHPGRVIQLDCEGDLHGCWDPSRMAQLLSNLLGNAIKHGAADRRVSLRATEHAAQVRSDVHNEGRPIPVEQRQRLFEPLARGALEDGTAPATERSVGLGLYIASEIAKAHGGTLRLAVSDDNGTTFSVLLPRTSVNPP
jgi:signal transduction histidine kinase